MPRTHKTRPRLQKNSPVHQCWRIREAAEQGQAVSLAPGTTWFLFAARDVTMHVRFCLVCRALVMRHPPNITRFAIPVYFTATALANCTDMCQNPNIVDQSRLLTSGAASGTFTRPPGFGWVWGGNYPRYGRHRVFWLACVCRGISSTRRLLQQYPRQAVRTGPNG